MGLSSTDKLAKELGHNNIAISNIQQNISPDEEDAALQLRFTDAIEVVGELTITKKILDDGALAFDRPEQGQMFDNDTKQFDLGYDNTLDEIIYVNNF